MNLNEFWKSALSCDEKLFEELSLNLFQYQAANVVIYKSFLEKLNINPVNVKAISDIPFLPVQLFKSNKVLDKNCNTDFYFSSSGTTGQITSNHYVPDLSVYDDSLLQGFKYFYGDPSQYCFLALLPSYLERKGSSLVYMAQKLIDASSFVESGFYLNNINELYVKLQYLKEKRIPIFLLGVTYALLDLFEQFQINLEGSIIMETGGMKGKRAEIIRADLHQQLINNASVSTIHSEYGMTELLSQAYSTHDGIFACPPWMKVFISESNDPFQFAKQGETGLINVIDLANIHSCAFIATQDMGRMHGNNFEVLGRMDNSELRGCNLMIA